MGNSKPIIIGDDGLLYDVAGDPQLDENGKPKKSYTAGYIGKNGDLEAIAKDFFDRCEEQYRELRKVLEGENYDGALSAIERLKTVFTSGPHIQFVKLNSWLDDEQKANKFFSDPGELTVLTKKKMVVFLQMVRKSAEFRDEFVKFLNDVSLNLYTPFEAILFEINMKGIIKAEDKECINKAFSEFDDICKMFNNSSIYNTMVINKQFYSTSEAKEVVLDYMDSYIRDKSNLCNFLVNSKSTSAEGMNRMHIIDRKTCAWVKIANKQEFMGKVVDKYRELSKQAQALYNYGTEDLNRYFDAMNRVLDVIGQIYKDGYTSIENIKDKRYDAPYSIMYYDTPVKECVNRHMLGSLDYIKDCGTSYRLFAQGMLSRLRELAEFIAKNAPD